MVLRVDCFVVSQYLNYENEPETGNLPWSGLWWLGGLSPEMRSWDYELDRMPVRAGTMHTRLHHNQFTHQILGDERKLENPGEHPNLHTDRDR